MMMSLVESPGLEGAAVAAGEGDGAGCCSPVCAWAGKNALSKMVSANILGRQSWVMGGILSPGCDSRPARNAVLLSLANQIAGVSRPSLLWRKLGLDPVALQFMTCKTSLKSLRQRTALVFSVSPRLPWQVLFLIILVQLCPPSSASMPFAIPATRQRTSPGKPHREWKSGTGAYKHTSR